MVNNVLVLGLIMCYFYGWGNLLEDVVLLVFVMLDLFLYIY